jgi:phosphoglycolate phosphatase-like HAD superfamily hydrolase
MNMTVIFDVDGTIANCEHRVHWVRSRPSNWAAFNRAMHLDTPNADIVWLLRAMHAAGATILIASARGAEQRQVTEDWLRDSAGVGGLYEKLYMRAAGDNRSDDIVKSEILDQMILDGYQPSMAVDDRDRVVKTWRARGLRCLQVAEGNF